jgi:hypothetical protein
MGKIAMTLQQIKLIRISFASVRSISDTAAALFYGRLFELDHPWGACFTAICAYKAAH